MSSNRAKALILTASEHEALKEKLQTLMDEANGVDIWLAPGTEVLEECFLDCDEEAHFRLGAILERLGGNFTAHRDSNFKPALELPDSETVKLPLSHLLKLLDNLAEIERQLESIGIDNGDFYTKVSMNVSNLSNMLLDAGWNGEIPK